MTSLKYGLALLFSLQTASALACSAFCLTGQNQVVVGKSYDWFFGHGFGAVYTNPRGTARKTLVFDDSPKPASWVSKYGSVTLTQFGRGVPISGMNENGLVVEMLQLETSVYNSHETERPYVNEAQWAQFQLDNFATIDEVIAHINELRVVKAYTGIHYFIADPSGKTVAVDFVDGKVVLHTGKDLPVPALTNDSYDHLTAYLEAHPGASPTSAWERTSEVRFKNLEEIAKQNAQTPGANPHDLAWQALEAVRLNGLAKDALMEPSQWNIVHDLKARTISFRTRTAGEIKVLDLNQLDLREGAPEMMVDMNLRVSGDLNGHLHPYSFKENAALIKKNRWLFKLAGQSSKVQTAIDYGRVSCERIW